MTNRQTKIFISYCLTASIRRINIDGLSSDALKLSYDAMILTLASSITKRISKAIAPKFLRWSLNLHEYNTKLSLLPLAQRLVSIEVQDDYLLMSSKLNGQVTHNKSMVGQISSVWENFVDQTWDIFFESRHQKLKAGQEEQLLPKAKDQKQIQKQIQKQYNESELATQRVQLLEQYVRPALLPNNSEHDLMRNLFTAHEQQDEYSQQSNYDYFVKWIRGEYLIAKYGLAVKQAVKEYPILRDDVAGLSSVGGTQSIDGDEVEVPIELILPKLDTIRSAFSMEDWSRTKVPVSSWKDEDESNSKITAQHDSLSLKNIIHNKLQGQISYSGPLNAYFEMRRREDSYELWNYDYIFALANYLLDRIKALDSVESAPLQTTILDVGAGDGRLVYFLRRAMHQIMVSNTSAASSSNISLHRKGKKTKSKIKAKPQPTLTPPRLIATDDGSWKAPIYSNKHIQVEKLSVVEAVAKYAPPPPELSPEGESSRLIVLCSWMPPQVDWTASFRTPSSSIYAPGESGAGIVEEYILIGECDDGTCGHNFHTWGNPDAYERESQDDGDENVLVAPYITDGYQRVDLEELSLLQVSRFDCKRSSESKTVSFRRGGNIF